MNLEAAEDLDEIIQTISQEQWAAGWMNGIEYEVWSWVVGDEATPTAFLRDTDRAKELSEACHGWVIFPDWMLDKGEPLPYAVGLESGEVWVPLDKWKEMYARWRERPEAQ